jgi:hypothetical protein
MDALLDLLGCSQCAWDALHESQRRVHLRTRAICFVAHPRNGYGHCCGSRLASHPDPQRTLPAGFVQNIPGGAAGVRQPDRRIAL